MIGYILAWSSLLPFCLGVSFVTLIAFRRDLHTISYFLGIVLNEATNLILKHIIQEPRPKRGRDNLYTEYGMPSSHTQFMWFFATYMVFFISVRVYRNYNIIDDLWKIAVCTLSFLAAAVVTYSRIYLEYHTVGQVLCGAVLGIVNGTLWFAVVQFVLTPFFPLIAASPVGEFCMVRDSTLIPHVLWFEYTSSRSEARSRQRKSVSKNNKKELAEDAITKDLQVQMDHSPRLSLAVLDKYVHCSSSFLR
ncbi:dolichyldiphosphatase 1-like isoform X3 [Pomacea canaliculata]|nr:dolichyldiphosphatase 1-like isoform X3 [Pomacea canaliculata]